MAKIHLSKVDEHIDDQLVFKAGDIEKLVGKRSHLKYLIKEKRIIAIGSGYYSTPKLERYDSLILILHKYFPKAVISGRSALYIHGLLPLPEKNHKVEADILNTTSQRSHLFGFSRVASSRMIGSEIKNFHGRKIHVYSVERSLADLVLKDESPEIIQTALTSYLDYPHKNNVLIDELDAILGTDVRKRLDEVFLRRNYGSALGPNERQRLLEKAISLYAQYGSQVVSPRQLAIESNMSLRRVNIFFKTKNDVIAAIFEAVYHRMIRTGFSPYQSDNNSPRKWLVHNIDAYLKMIEEDPITYRIQRWSLAEQNSHHYDLLKIWNDLINGVTETVMFEVDNIERKQAESRSLVFLSLIDQYANIRWYIARHLAIESKKMEIIQNYKHEVLGQMERILFSPAEE